MLIDVYQVLDRLFLSFKKSLSWKAASNTTVLLYSNLQTLQNKNLNQRKYFQAFRGLITWRLPHNKRSSFECVS